MASGIISAIEITWCSRKTNMIRHCISVEGFLSMGEVEYDSRWRYSRNIYTWNSLIWFDGHISGLSSYYSNSSQLMLILNAWVGNYITSLLDRPPPVKPNWQSYTIRRGLLELKLQVNWRDGKTWASFLWEINIYPPSLVWSSHTHSNPFPLPSSAFAPLLQNTKYSIKFLHSTCSKRSY